MSVIQPRRLGIIGGVGPEATARLYARVVNGVQARTRRYPAVTIENLSFDADAEEAFVTGRADSADQAEFEHLLCSSVARLSAAGADCITIPCNTLHPLLDPIVQRNGRHFIHAIRATLARAAERGYRRGGVLATSSTRASDLYGLAATPFGIEIVYPSDDLQREVAALINRLLRQESVDDAAAIVSAVARQFDAVDFVVLGCTDLSVLFDRIDAGVPLLDSLDCLADECIEYLVEGHGG